MGADSPGTDDVIIGVAARGDEDRVLAVARELGRHRSPGDGPGWVELLAAAGGADGAEGMARVLLCRDEAAGRKFARFAASDPGRELVIYNEEPAEFFATFRDARVKLFDLVDQKCRIFRATFGGTDGFPVQHATLIHFEATCRPAGHLRQAEADPTPAPGDPPSTLLVQVRMYDANRRPIGVRPYPVFAFRLADCRADLHLGFGSPSGGWLADAEVYDSAVYAEVLVDTSAATLRACDAPAPVAAITTQRDEPPGGDATAWAEANLGAYEWRQPGEEPTYLAQGGPPDAASKGSGYSIVRMVHPVPSDPLARCRLAAYISQEFRENERRVLVDAAWRMFCTFPFVGSYLRATHAANLAHPRDPRMPFPVPLLEPETEKLAEAVFEALAVDFASEAYPPMFVEYYNTPIPDSGGEAGNATVNLYTDTKILKVNLNQDVFAHDTLKRDSVEWAGIMAHECLHNLGWNHGSVYPGTWIRAAEDAIKQMAAAKNFGDPVNP